MELIVSTTNSPEANLAAEQHLVTERQDDVLFLYINSPSVILGRNQNPVAEADLDYCLKYEIPVIKRLSGGGTVFHDSGNINYSFIRNVEKGQVLDTDFLTPVIAALKNFGIEAVVGRRKELLVEGKKISGTASHVSKGRQLFHGTLLYDTNLEMLHKTLSGDVSQRGKHVASVSSEVTNIRDFIMGKPDTFAFFSALISFFKEYYACPEETYISTEYRKIG